MHLALLQLDKEEARSTRVYTLSEHIVGLLVASQPTCAVMSKSAFAVSVVLRQGLASRTRSKDNLDSFAFPQPAIVTQPTEHHFIT